MRRLVSALLFASVLLWGLVGAGPAAATPAATRACQAAFRDSMSRTEPVTFGTRTIYNRDASRYQVCLGFGAPEEVNLGLACSLAVAGYKLGARPTERQELLAQIGCVGPAIYESGWVRGAGKAAVSIACGYAINVLATGAGELN